MSLHLAHFDLIHLAILKGLHEVNEYVERINLVVDQLLSAFLCYLA